MGKSRKHLDRVPGVRIWKRKVEGAGAKFKMTYRDPDSGKDRTEVGSVDRDVTVEKARRISRRIERRRLGLVASVEDRHEEQDAVGIPGHLAAWRKSMEIGKRDAKHVRQFHDMVRDVLLGTPDATPDTRGRKKSLVAVRLPSLGIYRISQVLPSKVYEQIGLVSAERSAATANRYLDALNAFFNWGVPERWPTNPVAHLEKYSTAEDRRLVRRAIEPVDFLKLIMGLVGDDVPVVEKLTPDERSRLYRFAVQTGLRRKEIRKGVRKCDLVLTGGRLGVWTRASISRKNKKRQFVPFTASLAAELAEVVAGLGDEDLAIKCPDNTARMLAADLKRVGIPYKTAEGTFDFHAIRHQCGALFAVAGVNPKAIQRHMRHSRITLTMDTYGHLLEADAAAILNALPDFSQTGAQRNAQRQVGNERPSVSSNVREEGSDKKKEPLSEGGKAVLTQWSRGESNPHMLNAIQGRGAAANRTTTYKSRDLRKVTTPDSHGSAAQCAARGLRNIRRTLKLARGGGR